MLGLTRQQTGGSALLGWVGDDAITGQITARSGREQPQ
jgi:hypothetical protein